MANHMIRTVRDLVEAMKQYHPDTPIEIVTGDSLYSITRVRLNTEGIPQILEFYVTEFDELEKGYHRR